MHSITHHPILYSFRRCPYAMRARMALVYSQQNVQLREIILKNKPEAMLEVSPKATVPVLVLTTASPTPTVIDESLEIMLWCLERSDPDTWLPNKTDDRCAQLLLIKQNDDSFKHHLDHYKYAVRYPEHSPEHYRSQGEIFLKLLESRLSTTLYLFGPTISLADIAIFPFVRQFAHVDKVWFDQADYPKLQAWLEHFLNSALFKKIMLKHACWHPDDEPVFL